MFTDYELKFPPSEKGDVLGMDMEHRALILWVILAEIARVVNRDQTEIPLFC